MGKGDSDSCGVSIYHCGVGVLSLRVSNSAWHGTVLGAMPGIRVVLESLISVSPWVEAFLYGKCCPGVIFWDLKICESQQTQTKYLGILVHWKRSVSPMVNEWLARQGICRLGKYWNWYILRATCMPLPALVILKKTRSQKVKNFSK